MDPMYFVSGIHFDNLPSTNCTCLPYYLRSYDLTRVERHAWRKKKGQKQVEAAGGTSPKISSGVQVFDPANRVGGFAAYIAQKNPRHTPSTGPKRKKSAKIPSSEERHRKGKLTTRASAVGGLEGDGTGRCKQTLPLQKHLPKGWKR